MSQLVPPIVLAPSLSESDVDFSSEFTSEGGESTADLEDLPSRELLDKLVETLEYHFGDEYLANDLFLLKHIKRQPEGFVSLKLLANYKKVKKLSRNWRIVGLAAKQSNKLELNENGTRVRRRDALPQNLSADLPSSRTVIAVGVPQQLCTIEALANRFAACGTVAALQLLKPGKSNMNQLQLLITSKMSHCVEMPCAIIEFENVWGASKALQESYEPPMTLYSMKNRKRDHRATPENRSSGRPFHHQLHRLLNEGSSKQGSESSGSDGDEATKAAMSVRSHAKGNQFLCVRRHCSSVPTSPALRRYHFSEFPCGQRSPRNPNGPDAPWRDQCLSPR